MWADRNQDLIYQTMWFDHFLATFDRKTGQLVNNLMVGPDPSHAMTLTSNDHVHIALDGSDDANAVVEIAPCGGSILRTINIGEGHPHAHWMGHTGEVMVTPNSYTADSTIFDFGTNSIRTIVPVGNLPIATSMMPDDSKYYVANFLDSTITVINTGTGAVKGTVNLLANYDPISGTITGPVGGLPI